MRIVSRRIFSRKAYFRRAFFWEGFPPCGIFLSFPWKEFLQWVLFTSAFFYPYLKVNVRTCFIISDNFVISVNVILLRNCTLLAGTKDKSHLSTGNDSMTTSISYTLVSMVAGSGLGDTSCMVTGCN